MTTDILDDSPSPSDDSPLSELQRAISAALRCAPISDELDRTTQSRMLELVESRDCADPRRPEAHFTASAFVLNREGEILALFHAKLQRWLQPGGHIETTDLSPLSAALREVHEETALTALEPLSPHPIDLDIHLIPASPKHGAAHLHFDIRYAFLYTGDVTPTINHESEGWRWLSGEALSAWMVDPSIGRAVERARSTRKLI